MSFIHVLKTCFVVDWAINSSGLVGVTWRVSCAVAIDNCFVCSFHTGFVRVLNLQQEVIYFTCCKYGMWNAVFCYRPRYWIRYKILDTLISTRCNCHFFWTTPSGYQWFKVVCGGIGLGSGCMLVGRAYVSWFSGWGSSCSCCLRPVELYAINNISITYQQHINNISIT